MENNPTQIRLSSPLQIDSAVDGPGLRMVLWFQGCLFACEGCHNPSTWQIDGGEVYEIDDILEEIRKHKHLDGITLSGGDPMFQSHALAVLLPEIKEMGLNVWMYSGDRYENLLKQKDFIDIYRYIDTLVDGRFVLSLRDLTLKYRGSTNQRLINVQESISKDEIVEEDFNEESNSTK